MRVDADDPESLAPAVVRALVAAGADIVEVRAERTVARTRSTSTSWASGRAPTASRTSSDARRRSSGRSCAASGSRCSAIGCCCRRSSPADRSSPSRRSSSPAPSASGPCRRSWPPRSSSQRPEWAAFTAGELAGRLRGPAVPRVLPADARLHPAVDRDVLDHRREAGALPGAGPGRADPDLGAAGRQGRRRARAGRARRLGDLRRLRRSWRRSSTGRRCSAS